MNALIDRFQLIDCYIVFLLYFEGCVKVVCRVTSKNKTFVIISEKKYMYSTYYYSYIRVAFQLIPVLLSSAPVPPALRSLNGRCLVQKSALRASVALSNGKEPAWPRFSYERVGVEPGVNFFAHDYFYFGAKFEHVSEDLVHFRHDEFVALVRLEGGGGVFVG